MFKLCGIFLTGGLYELGVKGKGEQRLPKVLA